MNESTVTILVLYPFIVGIGFAAARNAPGRAYWAAGIVVVTVAAAVTTALEHRWLFACTIFVVLPSLSTLWILRRPAIRSRAKVAFVLGPILYWIAMGIAWIAGIYAVVIFGGLPGV